MNESKISVRYAKAFFELALEKNVLDNVKSDMQYISDLYLKSNEFKILLESPIIQESLKIKIFKEIFSNKLNALTINFFQLITNNKRESYFYIISLNFIKLYLGHKGIKQAKISSATKINEESLEKIKDIINKLYNTKTEIKTEINKDLIGGFILRVDDKQYDASIASQLKKIKDELIKR